jgi:hypothetical protein
VEEQRGEILALTDNIKLLQDAQQLQQKYNTVRDENGALTESRTKLKDQANRASALANLCQAKRRQMRFLDSQLQHHASLLRQMNPSSPRFTDWTDMLNPVDDETFPRFVTYFLPYNAWPSAALADSEPPKYVSIIPGRTQYMAVCSAIDVLIDLQRVGTPPHHLRDDTRSTLDAGWAIWRDVVEDVLVRDLLCPGEGEEPDFDDQSEYYAALVRLYSKWLEVTSNAAERLIPLGVSMFDLETTAIGLEVTDGHQVQAMEESEDEQALIAAALQYAQKTNGAVPTRGRRSTIQ